MADIRLLFIIALMLASSSAVAQQDNFVSFVLENDFLYLQDQTDRFYTNGFRYERIGPRFQHRHQLVNNLLIRFPRRKTSLLYYGALFGQNMYTPQEITQTDIQFHDRPYSGWTYWGAKSISTNQNRNQRITSELSIGVLGPEALAGETQTFVHKVVDSDLPQGWSHQVDSDLGINYLIKYEIGTRMRDKWPMIDAIMFGKSTVGTIFTNAGVGGVLSIGKLDTLYNIYTIGSNSIESISNLRGTNAKGMKFWQFFINGFSQYFVFARPHARFDLYNAMLEGGMLNKRSVHLISADDLNRLFAQIDYGIAFTWYSFTAAYSQSIRTQEFTHGPSRHRWGAVNIIFTY